MEDSIGDMLSLLIREKPEWGQAGFVKLPQLRFDSGGVVGLGVLARVER
jgi:hypothetical protein